MENSPAVQLLGLCAFTAAGPGSIPSQGTKIQQAVLCCQNKQKEPRINEFVLKEETNDIKLLNV